MLAPGAGVVGTVKYWAGGSREKVLELGLSQIKHFGLTDSVRAHLGLSVSTGKSKTNAYIVKRAAAALEALKATTAVPHNIDRACSCSQ